MEKTRLACSLAVGVALAAPSASLARDSLGTGEPFQTLSQLELDLGFGRRGEVRSAARGQIRLTSLHRAALDADGRIVVGAVARDPATGAEIPCVARFLADGRLDRQFAGGIVALPVRGGPGGLAIDAAGNIVVCGKFRSPAGSTRRETGVVAVRVRANGRLDPTFARNGLAEADVSQIDEVRAAAVSPVDGSILELVTRWTGGYSADAGVVRLTSSGDVDATFGGDGFADVSTDAYGIAIDAQGGVIAGGTPVVRLGSDGARDLAFGTGGVLTGALGGDVGGTARLDGQGRIIVLGNGDGGGTALFRFLPNGSVDATLSGDGRTPVPMAVPHAFYPGGGLRFATAPGSVDRYAIATRLNLVDPIPGTGSARPAGVGYLVQTVNSDRPGALSAFVRLDPRPAERLDPEITDLVVSRDGAAAYAVGFEKTKSAGRWRTTPLLLRIDLTPRRDVPLPNYQIAWAEQPTATLITGPDSLVRVPHPTVRVSNSGADDPVGVGVILFLSDDDRLGSDDEYLGSWWRDEPHVIGSGTQTILTEVSIDAGFGSPGFTSLSGRRLIAVVNPYAWRPESDTTDNMAVSDPLP